MELKNYETVFIITPVLSEQQTKDTVEKFKEILKAQGAEIINEENWGLKQFTYPIKGKSSGTYVLFEFKAQGKAIATLEVEYKRDEKVIRYITVALDKYALEYNEKRRRGEFNKSKSVKVEEGKTV